MDIKKSNNYISFKKIKPYKLNKEPYLLTLENFKVIKNDNIITLYSSNETEYTSFHSKTYQNYFTYIINFFNYIKKNNIPKNKILILGFGIGGMSLKLSLDKNVKSIDAIDNNYKLFRIFKSIIKREPKKIKLLYNDVDDFLNTSNNKYNIIFDDIFSDNNKIMLNYDSIYNNLCDDGYLFINIHTNTQLDNIKKKLKKFEIVDLIKDNEMLLVCKKNSYYNKYLKYKIKYMKLVQSIKN